MLTDEAIFSIRNHLKSIFAFARYKNGGTYYEADIFDAEVLLDGRVAVAFMINEEFPDTHITEVQLCGADGTILASKTENIVRSDMHEGIFYRFYFTVEEAVLA